MSATQELEPEEMGAESSSGEGASADGAQREVRYEHSPGLAGLLAQLNATLAISTYQAGKVVLVGGAGAELSLSFHNFDRPMGVAIDARADRMAVAARNKVWFLRNDRNVARQLRSPGGQESCFLTRSAEVTGEIQAHEMAWCGEDLWVVNTLFSCLCTLSLDYSFVPRWRPPFISELVAEDRCHLNGMAVEDDRPRYVTAMARSDEAGGWRPHKEQTGCLIDLETNQVVADGFAMPHSPRVHGGQIWLLDSGRGALVRVDRVSHEVTTVARFPGYTRGLALLGTLAFVGLSKIRESSTFGGIPIAENRERLKCGVGVVDLQRGQLVGQLEFTTGVEEIFDVSLIPQSARTAMHGPFATEDGDATIWTVPPLTGG